MPAKLNRRPRFGIVDNEPPGGDRERGAPPARSSTPLTSALCARTGGAARGQDPPA